MLHFVFLHGSGPTDVRTWGQQIEPFAQRHRVIAYSRRYHSPNAWKGDGSEINSTSVHAQDLAGLLTALGVSRVHLVGFSYGADIALRFAVEHPHRLHSLVVAEPALFSWLVALPGGSELFAAFTGAMRPAKQAVQNGDLELGLRLFIDAVMGQDVFEQLPPSVHDRMMDNARLIGFEATEIGEVVTDITREQASTIQAPTLILTGEASPEMFLLVSQELARHLPDREQAQIPAASHLLHGMNPQAYNMAVLAFLARHAG